MIFPAGTCTQHLYGDACIKVPAPFFFWTYPILEPSAELDPARIYFSGGQRNVSTCCQQSFFGILLNGSILPSRFSNLSYGLLAKSSPATTEEPTCPLWRGGFFFHKKTWTIIPTLGSLRVYVHPWSGTVSFLCSTPCSLYSNSRKCVHTPLTLRGIHSREQTHPLHTPRSTPSCISIQDSSRRVEVLRGTHYSEYPPTKKRCVVRWFDQKCYADTQDYPSSRKLRGEDFPFDYLTTTEDRP